MGLPFLKRLIVSNRFKNFLFYYEQSSRKASLRPIQSPSLFVWFSRQRWWRHGCKMLSTNLSLSLICNWLWISLLIMLKKNLIRVVGDTARGVDPNMSRLDKFEVFCRVCDSLLADGRISSAQHSSWTNIFWSCVFSSLFSLLFLGLILLLISWILV